MSGSRLGLVPNLITIARLCLVPVTISMIVDERWSLAFALFAVAGVSDAVDGFIAKRFHLTTELGAYLDPAADKALLVSIYVALAIVRVIPSWLATLVVTRDIMIVGAVLISRVLDRPVAIRPLWISKVNTTAQIAFAGTMLATKGFGVDLGVPIGLPVAIVAALTLASAGAYLTQWLRHMSS